MTLYYIQITPKAKNPNFGATVKLRRWTSGGLGDQVYLVLTFLPWQRHDPRFDHSTVSTLDEVECKQAFRMESGVKRSGKRGGKGSVND